MSINSYLKQIQNSKLLLLLCLILLALSFNNCSQGFEVYPSDLKTGELEVFYLGSDGLPHQTVKKYEQVDGDIIIDGDIIVTNEEELLRNNKRVVIDFFDPNNKNQNLVIDNPMAEKLILRSMKLNSTKLWPKGIVPIELDEALPATQVKAITEAVITLNKKLKDVKGGVNLRITYRTTESPFVFIRYKPNLKNYCTADLGAMGRATRYMNLGSCSKAGIIHEFMHIFGVKHEHQRDDRDRYITIQKFNIDDKWKGKGIESAFDKYSFTRNYGPYDINSIMHYGSFSFNKPAKRTIVSNDSKSPFIKRRTELTERDIAGVKAMYGGNFSDSIANDIINESVVINFRGSALAHNMTNLKWSNPKGLPKFNIYRNGDYYTTFDCRSNKSCAITYSRDVKGSTTYKFRLVPIDKNGKYLSKTKDVVITTPGKGETELINPGVSSMANNSGARVESFRGTALAHNMTNLRWSNPKRLPKFNIYRNGSYYSTFDCRSNKDCAITYSKNVKALTRYKFHLVPIDKSGKYLPKTRVIAITTPSNPNAELNIPSSTVAANNSAAIGDFRGSALAHNMTNLRWLNPKRLQKFNVYRNGRYYSTFDCRRNKDCAITYSKDVKANTTYKFYLKPKDKNGKSLAKTKEVKIQTPSIPTQAISSPKNLRLDYIRSRYLKFIWNRVSGAISYDIYRDGKYIISTKGTSRTDMGLVPNKKYKYEVKAKNSSGRLSGKSKPLYIKTPNK